MMEGMAASGVDGTAVVAPGRVVSVDVLRGMTIALMILVNDPGDWGHTFTQLDHAKWNGWTLTDMVFPTFLFLVGASIVFSMMARAAKGNCKATQAGHIFIRFAKLVVLAWVLSFFPRMHWTMRNYGVLTRIALCYLVGALILLATRKVRVILPLVVVILVGYWALMRFVPIPGAGHPVKDFPILDPMWNLAAWMDRGISAWMLKWLHTGRLYEGTRDPEGFLSTLPAVGTVLIGALVGMWMRRPEWAQGVAARSVMRLKMFAAGVAMFVAGTVWGLWFPVNKNLWTNSYVLVMAGMATVLLAVLNALVDQRPQPWPAWLRVATWPWLVFGSNAIAAFTVGIVFIKVLIYVHVGVTEAGKPRSLMSLVYHDVFARNGSNDWTSLAFAICFVAVCFLPVWVLWRKKIFLRM
jgi:predicted acyltransferase